MNKFNKLFYIGLIIFVFPLIIICLPFIFNLIEPTPPLPVEKSIYYDTVKVKVPVHIYDTIKIEKIFIKYIENDTTRSSN
jgi:hypothetical protein